MSKEISFIFPKSQFSALDRENYRKLVDYSLEKMNCTNPEMSIKFMTSRDIKELNKKYRGIDKETDVISFSSGESNPETGNLYLGDIAIAYDVASTNAITHDKTIKQEISLLIVHGILHLLNYSDETNIGYTEMVELQNKLLQDFQAIHGQIY